MSIDLLRLKAILAQTGTQQSNNSLYQLLFSLIDFDTEIQNGLQAQITTLNKAVFGTTPNDPSKSASLVGAAYLTAADNHKLLPASRELLAGDGIEFIDSVVNKRTIKSTGGDGSGDLHPFLLMGAHNV